MVTSCQWRQMKVITPQGEASKVVYVFSQTGRQQLENGGANMTTLLSTNASRFEFITIQEVLEAQQDAPADDELVAQFLRCDQEVLEGAKLLPEPFSRPNIKQSSAVAVPFAVYYFANWSEDERPILALPVSLFSGQVAPDLLQYMRLFPLSLEGLPVVVEPNISLPAGYAVAARSLEQALSNRETGRTGLIWCDVAIQQERHRRWVSQQAPVPTWDHLQVEGGSHQILGLQPVEYLNVAVVMVPFVAMAFHRPVQDCGYGILDPVLGNMHLTPKQIQP